MKLQLHIKIDFFFCAFLLFAKKSLSKGDMISNTLVLFKYTQTKFTSLTRHCKIFVEISLYLSLSVDKT